jgi:hypothetical protein
MGEKTENPGMCDCCCFDTEDLSYFVDVPTKVFGRRARFFRDAKVEIAFEGSEIGEPRNKVDLSDYWLCLFCSRAVLGNALRYPNEIQDTATLRVVCFVGNVLLEALRKRR